MSNLVLHIILNMINKPIPIVCFEDIFFFFENNFLILKWKRAKKVIKCKNWNKKEEVIEKYKQYEQK